MGRRVFWLAAAVASTILIRTATASAQDWKAEWDKVVAAANAEGTLVLDSQPNIEMRKYVQDEWAKAYPKIALSVSTTPGTQFLALIRTERSVDKYLWDASVSSVTTAYTLYHESILDPLQPEFILPDVKNPVTWGGWDNVFMDKAGKYVFGMSAALKSPYYNTAKVSADEVAKLGLKTLLDPAYKGKILWHDPLVSGSGQTFAYVLRTRLGRRSAQEADPRPEGRVHGAARPGRRGNGARRRLDRYRTVRWRARISRPISPPASKWMSALSATTRR